MVTFRQNIHLIVKMDTFRAEHVEAASRGALIFIASRQVESMTLSRFGKSRLFLKKIYDIAFILRWTKWERSHLRIRVSAGRHWKTSTDPHPFVPLVR